ncbi:MAG: hypothetical protein ONB05_09690, partial [candidate division KSB1 bacterium]|nr:hypothetical protein [candidate division KSB1 bacterium]
MSLLGSLIDPLGRPLLFKGKKIDDFDSSFLYYAKMNERTLDTIEVIVTDHQPSAIHKCLCHIINIS